MRINDDQQKASMRPLSPFSEFPNPGFSSALALNSCPPLHPISAFQFFSICLTFPISAFAPRLRRRAMEDKSGQIEPASGKDRNKFFETL
jgi:hypothetical protein